MYSTTRARHICVLVAMLLLLLRHVTAFAENGEIEGFATDGEIHRVLVNGSAQIKCDVSSNIPDDQVLLVVWYKNNLPIYSYDTRGAHAGTPSHWRDEEVLEDRAIFRTLRVPAELIITPVLEKDVGNFRCRVDFKMTPTRNSNVNLEVVVPPHPPKIFDDSGANIDRMAGPYEEGAELHLTCVVMGGSPPPTVTWLSNGQMLSSTMIEYSYQSSLNNKLVVRNLSRAHQHAVYTCHASNFHKKGVSTNVTVELYLRPLSVEIMFPNQPLSSDRMYEVDCEAVGSRPPAKITWWMDGIELRSHSQKVSLDGNVTTSSLQFTPTRQDNGKALVCKASNEFVKRSTKENAMKLNVCFIPTLLLELGSNLNSEDIEEGDDVYFECKVHANPAAYKVIWKHNGQTIQHNQKSGVIVSSGDLALQGVTRHQAGNYTCIASNVEGDGESNTVELKVMYKPMCRPDQKKVYGVARNEAAHILCEVDAFPPPEAFKWSFNNTAETLDMPQSGFEKHSPRASKLTYIPIKELDFGTIMCWADNAVGQQKEPCVFHLIAAGKPDAPYNCSLVNQTSDSLEVDCSEGFDGGQRQWFAMEIFDQQTGMLQANVSAKLPLFTVGGLDAGRLLTIRIFSANVKGRSEPVVLEAFTLKAAEKQTGTHNQFQFAPMLSFGILVFIGLLTALVCITVGTLTALKLRSVHQRRRHTAMMMHSGGATGNGKAGGKGAMMLITRPGNLAIKEKIAVPLNQSEDMYDEKNPDVVPYNEDPDYKLKSAAQTPATLHHGGSNSHPSEHHQHQQQQQPHPEMMMMAVGCGGGRSATSVDDRSNAYMNTHPHPGDELHYAELSITIPRHPPHPPLLPPPPSIGGAASAAAAAYHHSQSAYAMQMATAGSGAAGDPSTAATGTLSRKPPAYDYFDEPTIYAQIDHYKSTAPATGAMVTACSAGTGGAVTSSTTPASSSAATSPFPTVISSPSSTISTSLYPAKPFSREIVTIRTPLIYTQQESCV